MTAERAARLTALGFAWVGSDSHPKESAPAPLAPVRSGYFHCDNQCGYGGAWEEVVAHERTCEVDEQSGFRARPPGAPPPA